MTNDDVDVLGRVLRDALGKHQQAVESLIGARTAEHVTAERAVELAREAVLEAEDRLRRSLDHQQSQVVAELRRAAADELIKQQNLLIARMTVADQIAHQLDELRAELQRSIDAAQPAPALAEVVDALKADEAFALAVKGNDGDQGEAGADGAGIDAKAWAPGIWREGAVVQAYVGQFYRAKRDTTDEPYRSDDWVRIGSAGFHFAEPYVEGRTYEPGDLFVREFGTFAWTGADAVLIAGRGAKGDQGLRGVAGKDGADGKDGKDGATVEAFEARGGALVLVLREHGGRLRTIDVDLIPLLETLGELVEARVIARLGGAPT